MWVENVDAQGNRPASAFSEQSRTEDLSARRCEHCEAYKLRAGSGNLHRGISGISAHLAKTELVDYARAACGVT
jgi:hypothetical protein